MKKKQNILIITPIRHIKDLYKRFINLGKITYLPDPNIDELLKLNKDIDVVFTNPNKSKIYLNKKIFNHFGNLKVICTASTGTVHINLNDANEYGIKVISISKEYKTLNQEFNVY